MKKQLLSFVALFLLMIAVVILIFIDFTNTSESPRVIYHKHTEAIFKNLNTSDTVTTGQPYKLTGVLRATANYFGVIQIRFNPLPKNDDLVIFRIKEEGQSGWYYEQYYNTAQISQLSFFPIGFPPIPNSKDKIYVFEIVSLYGTPTNGVTISSDNHVITTKYQYPSEVLSKPFSLFEYIWLKWVNEEKGMDSLVRFAIYLLPTIVLLIWSKKSKIYLLIPFIIALNIYYHITHSSSLDLIYASTFVACILFTVLYKVTYRYLLTVAIILLLFCPVFIFNLNNIEAERSANWAYFFLVSSIVSAVIEIIFYEKTANKQIIHDIQTCKIFQLMYQLFFYVNHVSIVFIEKAKFKCRTQYERIKKVISNIMLLYKKWEYSFLHFSPKSILHNIYNACIKIVFRLLFLFVAFALTLLVLFIGLTITRKIGAWWQKYQINSIRLSRTPRIEIIEPKIVYKANKIVIYGNNFGWDKEMLGLFVDGEKITTDLWTNSMIVFTIPLHWKPGIHKLWLEKPSRLENKNIVSISNSFIFRIIPVSSTYTKDDDLYFKQLKNLKKTTLEINGYK